MPEKMRKEFDRSKSPMNDENDGEDNQGDRFIKQSNPNEELAQSPEDHALRAESENSLEHENLQINPKAVATAQDDIEKERAKRRAEEAAEEWKPKVETQQEAETIAESDEGFFAKFFNKIGLRKAVASETRIGAGENRKYDKRNMGQKPEYKDKRQEESIH